MVEGSGASVCATVATEDLAVEATKQFVPHVVLMDVRLAAGGDGVRAAERIRVEADIPIIFCTAHADDPAFRARASAISHSSVLAKPVHADTLREAIQAVP